MKPMIRWQDWTNALLGAWLVVSPSVLGYSLDEAAAGNAMGVGAALLAFNVISACRLIDEGQELLNIVIGAWLLLSPFAFGFPPSSAAGVDTMAVGAVVALLAGWQIRDAARKRRA